MAVVLVLLGLLMLYFGGDWLVNGSARVATYMQISPMVAGLTVVAFGTSAPELAVSLNAVYTQHEEAVIGNVIGSNVFNVLLTLGISAVIVPLAVHRQVAKLQVPIMIAASILTALFCIGGQITRWEGVVLFAGVIVYTTWAIRRSRRETKAIVQATGHTIEVDHTRGRGDMILALSKVVVGMTVLVFGADFLVKGAVEIAESLGVSEVVIGLTIIAAGTSLPELAASVVAGLKGERDIAVGNVVGSNLFNLLAILGLTALAGPVPIPIPAETLLVDVPVMVAVALICYPVFIRGYLISRAEGAFFLLCYVAYGVSIYMRSVGAS